MNIRPIVKYHGGKGRIFPWIIGQFRPHRVYLEPFGGAASVLLNKPRSEAEIYGELEPCMFNLMRTVQTDFDTFFKAVEAIPYNKDSFLHHKAQYENNTPDNTTHAVSFYVAKRMSRGGLCERFSWSKRMYSTGPAEEHCWRTALVNLSKVHERLQGVTILNENAFDLIPKYADAPDCLMYLDPPYLLSTRVYKKAYDHEFDNADHQRLADLIVPAKSMVLLSGYDSTEYQNWFGGWRRSGKEVGNHSSQHNDKLKVRKEEVVWANYA